MRAFRTYRMGRACGRTWFFWTKFAESSFEYCKSLSHLRFRMFMLLLLMRMMTMWRRMLLRGVLMRSTCAWLADSIAVLQESLSSSV